MTDWGIHFIDPIHQCLGEPMPSAITALGGRTWIKDNLQTADTMDAAFQYPTFLMNYELRRSVPTPMFGQGGATGIMGTEAMLTVTRSGCWLTPNKDSKVEAVEFLANSVRPAPGTPPQPSDHWKNFLECIKTRQKPTSDIENLVKSTSVCVLANVALRAKTRIDLDAKNYKVSQREAQPFLGINYRAPWKLEV
jgi:predicted dehydrogenase